MATTASLFAILVFGTNPFPPARHISVYEDRYGVPSIVASNIADASYGIGYVEAKDHAVRMALNYKLARGRLAEVNGKGSLLQDGFLRGLGFEAKAEQTAGTLKPEMRAVLDNFLAGANRALSEQKGSVPSWIEPFTAVDVISLGQFINAAFPLLDLSSKLMPGSGSNQFALAPSRTSTGHAILSMDPHLGWDGQDGGIIWEEIGLYLPDAQFRGVVIPGVPSAVMGHTGRVAWSMTNNNPLLYTIYNVKTNPQNRNQYSYHGEWREFKTAKQEMRYVENGQLKTNVVTTRSTDWGPMVPFSSHAVRLSNPPIESAQEQWVKMLRARNVREFRDALKTQGLSMWNFVFADVEGNIAYQYNAYVPQRDESIDWSKVVDGSDPKTKWGEPWSLDALPHVQNPASGILVNCNSSPLLTPLGPDVKGTWPSDVTSYGPTTRWEGLKALLTRATKVDPKTSMAYATDCAVPYALQTVRQLEKCVAPSDSIEVLKKWNGKATVDAVGCLLYTYWLRENRENSALAHAAGNGREWDSGQMASAKASFDAAVKRMLKEQGSLYTTWGSVQYMERGTVKRPVQGFGYVAPGSDLAAVSPASAGSDTLKNGRSHCTFGSSWRMIVSLDPKGIQSWSVLPYGNSSNPSSPHYADQMDLYSVGKYKSTGFGVKSAKRNSVKSYSLEF